MKKIIVGLFGHRQRSQPVDFSAVTSVLLKPIGDAVGDAIVHIAHLRQLKKAFPHARIGVFVSPRNEAVFRQSGLVDLLLADRAYNYLSQRRRWDLYLDFTPNYTSRAIILDALLQPGIIIHFDKHEKKHYSPDKVKNYDFSIRLPDFTHIKDYLKYSPLKPFLPDEEVYYWLARRDNHINNLWTAGRLHILLNPQGSNRQLPAEELNELLARIQPRFHSHIELLLTNTQAAKDYLLQLIDSPIPVRLAAQTDILQYFFLIASSDIVIAVDGGGVHIACAYGKPLLAFYANNIANYSRWAVNPQQGVNTLMLISQNEPGNDNTITRNFAIQSAATWLNDEIERQLCIKQH